MNTVTVAQLRDLLAGQDDDLPVAVSCCASRDSVHLIEAPGGVVNAGHAYQEPGSIKVLRLWADRDYRSVIYSDRDTD